MAIANVATEPVIEATVPAMKGAKRSELRLIFIPRRSCLLDAAAVAEPLAKTC
jgi:hypothetical protein